jgi:hypothetical protein
MANHPKAAPIIKNICLAFGDFSILFFDYKVIENIYKY